MSLIHHLPLRFGVGAAREVVRHPTRRESQKVVPCRIQKP